MPPHTRSQHTQAWSAMIPPLPKKHCLRWCRHLYHCGTMQMGITQLLLLAALCSLPACKQQQAGQATPQEASSTPLKTTGAQDAERPLIIALGDSLTAGFGLPAHQSYPAVLQQLLKARGYQYRVINAGVSGDTSAGGLARLSWVLQRPAEMLIVALGANDGLRGLSTAALQSNLDQLLRQAKPLAKHLVLAGMRMPTNYDPAYRKAFTQVYAKLAAEHEVIWLPFLLSGVALNPQLNQADGIHPNAAGAKIVAAHVLDAITPALKQAQHR